MLFKITLIVYIKYYIENNILCIHMYIKQKLKPLISSHDRAIGCINYNKQHIILFAPSYRTPEVVRSTKTRPATSPGVVKRLNNAIVLEYSNNLINRRQTKASRVECVRTKCGSLQRIILYNMYVCVCSNIFNEATDRKLLSKIESFVRIGNLHRLEISGSV